MKREREFKRDRERKKERERERARDRENERDRERDITRKDYLVYYEDKLCVLQRYCISKNIVLHMHIVFLLNCSLYPHLKEKTIDISNFSTLTDNFFVSDLILLNLLMIACH